MKEPCTLVERVILAARGKFSKTKISKTTRNKTYQEQQQQEGMGKNQGSSYHTQRLELYFVVTSGLLWQTSIRNYQGLGTTEINSSTKSKKKKI
jgi:hypothetical protein